MQREQFWTEDMSGVDWDAVYAQYAPLVERISSRAELSDLLWELQGELGTSHAYEMGGEYRHGPYYRQGSLGVDWTYDAEHERYRIARIIKGDPSDSQATSPLTGPGLHVAVGDAVLAMNGQQVGASRSPQELLVNQAGCEVQLLLEDPQTQETRTVVVRALSSDTHARYREWVERNRRTVHDVSQNRVGYIHSFKLMGLGPLIGMRTWGGVIGISPHHRLVDNTVTTQPEYSFWFKDVGWKVENYGTDPDIEVDIAPQDFAQQSDPQLARAISEALRLVEEVPALEPKAGDRPQLGRKLSN